MERAPLPPFCDQLLETTHVTEHLSAAAKTLLEKKIASVLQFDVLLLVFREAERWWDAAQVGASLRVPIPAASAALEELATASLLDVRIGNTIAYRFAPARAQTAALIKEVASADAQAREVLSARTGNGMIRGGA